MYALSRVLLSFFLLHALFIDLFFFFKQKTAYEMRISDWSSDVCSSDLPTHQVGRHLLGDLQRHLLLRLRGRGAEVRLGDDLVQAEQHVLLGRDRKSVV